MSIIKFAETLEEKESCYEVFSQLRPFLKSKKHFMERLERMEKTNNYSLVYLKKEKVEAVAGIRKMETFYQGKLIYVDDLVTNENSRSKGYGKELIGFLKNYVKIHNFVG